MHCIDLNSPELIWIHRLALLFFPVLTDFTLFPLLLPWPRLSAQQMDGGAVPQPSLVSVCVGFGMRGAVGLPGWLQGMGATKAVEEDMGWSWCNTVCLSVLQSEDLEVEHLILQLWWRKLSIMFFVWQKPPVYWVLSEPGPKCRPNFFHGLIPHRPNIADNLQIDKTKLVVRNTRGNTELTWFKESSSAEEDLLSCATCGWIVKTGRP